MDATMSCRCALSALIVTRSVKVAVLYACAHTHATGQLSGTDLPASLAYSPTALAAFSRNREPSRIYRRSIAVPLWPVCSR